VASGYLNAEYPVIVVVVASGFEPPLDIADFPCDDYIGVRVSQVKWMDLFDSLAFQQKFA